MHISEGQFSHTDRVVVRKWPYTKGSLVIWLLVRKWPCVLEFLAFMCPVPVAVGVFGEVVVWTRTNKRKEGERKVVGSLASSNQSLKS